MQHYAYRIYKNGNLNSPKFGGTVSARSMEDAANRIITLNRVKVVTTPARFGVEGVSNFYLDNEKVGIVIYVNPEDHKE